ncbi:MAG: FimV/HubP family polar landmark protein, partial [Spongiibacteraceae bacterium]
MVRKKLAMAVLALSALQADLASALGLGNLSVKSALNQPLSAEIKLLDTGDLDPSQIKVQLATPEDFERAGVDRNFFLTNLKFVVDLDGRGSGAIRITTHDSVSEPYLNFVVEAKWPNGRLLREFAVLLDPPTFSGGAAQPAAAPRAGTPAARPAPTTPTPTPTRDLQPPTISTEPAASSTAERIESNTLPDAGSATEHRVQVNETLSQIAAQHRPADTTVQQTMVAIQRANPEAFINSNINLIKSGAVLRLPSADDARAVGAGDATQQIAEQTHAWRSSSGSSEPASGPQLDASQPQSAAAGGSQDAERLTIATPGSSDKSTVGEGSGKNTKGLEALRNQLAASQEGLDSAKRDNKELQSRLDDMERQVATLQRLISLKDDQLAAVQAKSAAPGATAVPATPAAPAATAQPAPAEIASSETQSAETPSAGTASVTPPPVAAAPKPVVKPPVAKTPAAPEPSFLDKLTSEPLYWGGALAALVLLLGGGALAAKKRRELAEVESAYQELDLEDYTDTTIAADDDLDTASISDDAIVPAGMAQSAVEAEKKPAVRSETGDAIAEADIYIAYGRYQQAVDLLTGAIDAEPERADLRVKLLEVLVEMRNRDAFRQQFTSLQTLGDSAAVVQVKDMLSSVDGVSDWLNDLPQSASSTGGNFAVAGLVGGAAAGAAAVIAADKFDEELDEELTLEDDELDLDLDLDLDDEAPIPNAEFAAAPIAELPTEPLEELELDLDGDDLDLPGTDDIAGGLETSSPAFDPFANSESAFASSEPTIDLELDLDDEELDLDFNEDDLDFALRAMEGDKSEVLDPAVSAFAAGADNGGFGATDFGAPDFTTPDFATPGFTTADAKAPDFADSSLESPNFEAPDFTVPETAAETFSLDDELESFATAPTPAP